MTDIEMIRHCADAIGVAVIGMKGRGFHAESTTNLRATVEFVLEENPFNVYDPLHNDAQAIALMKRFRLTCVAWDDGSGTWEVGPEGFDCTPEDVINTDLNRAIVECVSKILERRRHRRKP